MDIKMDIKETKDNPKVESTTKDSTFLHNKINKSSFLICRECGHEGKWSIICEKCKSYKFAS